METSHVLARWLLWRVRADVTSSPIESILRLEKRGKEKERDCSVSDRVSMIGPHARGCLITYMDSAEPSSVVAKEASFYDWLIDWFIKHSKSTLKIRYAIKNNRINYFFKNFWFYTKWFIFDVLFFYSSKSFQIFLFSWFFFIFILYENFQFNAFFLQFLFFVVRNWNS